MYDVAIIGCGVVGAAAAYRLARCRLRVLVLEAGNDVANATTKANSAILHAGYDPEPGTRMAALNVEGNRMALDICRRLDVPVRQTGSLVLAFAPEQLPHLQTLYERGLANGVPGLSNEAHIGYYGQFLDRLKKTYPNAMIYVESLTPISQDSEYIRDTFNTEKLNDFNERLYQLAQEKGVYYLNVQEALKDDSGYLISDYDAGDGMHLKSNGHKAMYQYYLTHAVQPDGYIDKIV